MICLNTYQVSAYSVHMGPGIPSEVSEKVTDVDCSKNSQENMGIAKPRKRSPHIWAAWGSPEKETVEWPLVWVTQISGSQFAHLQMELIISPVPQSQVSSETLRRPTDVINQVSRKLKTQMQCQMLGRKSEIIKPCNLCPHNPTSHSNTSSHLFNIWGEFYNILDFMLFIRDPKSEETS